MPDSIVVDANVAISTLIRRGTPSTAFSLNALLHRFAFVAPELLLEEVDRNRQKILGLTKLSEEEFNETHSFLLSEIDFVPAPNFASLLPKAKTIAPHDKDAPYVALALAFDCPIFSGDKGLLQMKEVKVYSPRQMLELLTAQEYDTAKPHHEHHE